MNNDGACTARDENDVIGDNNSPPLEIQAESNQESNEQETEKIEAKTEVDACEETEVKAEKPKCQICEENEADVAFKPCGHIPVCTGLLFVLLLFRLF